MTTKPKAKAKARAKAKPKAAPKPPPQDDQITNNEGTSTSMATETPTAPAGTPKPAATRGYRITKKLVLDTTDAPSLLQQLQALTDDKDPQPVTVFALVGVGTGGTPPSALKQFGAGNDMAGDYELVAEPNIVEFKNVTTKQERAVSFG